MYVIIDVWVLMTNPLLFFRVLFKCKTTLTVAIKCESPNQAICQTIVSEMWNVTSYNPSMNNTCWWLQCEDVRHDRHIQQSQGGVAVQWQEEVWQRLHHWQTTREAGEQISDSEVVWTSQGVLCQGSWSGLPADAVCLGVQREVRTLSIYLRNDYVIWTFTTRYRLDMINWSTKIREQDYTYFCRAAEEKYDAFRYSH